MPISHSTPKRDGWYKARNHPHFDMPLSFDDAKRYVSDPAKVAKHSFYPFLAFDISHRRFKGGNKVRPIRMAAHRDGYIFAYYGKLLNDAYEKRIAGTAVSNSVLAYRKGLGSNIRFADAAFREVERRRKCVAIALDIKSFFESIDHAQLKESWSDLIEVPRLPRDHYAVFKSVTRYSLVERKRCYKQLGIAEENPPRPLCTPKQFRDEIRGNGLVITHPDDFGIPQGSQISAILSNVYMLPFDKKMCSLAEKIDGYYRRYCDDILWIVNSADAALVETETAKTLSKLGGQLKLNCAKTVVSTFNVRFGRKIYCVGRPLQYLGFEFDGQHRLIRCSTLSRYWRKVIVGIRSTKRKANKAAKAGGNPVPFRRGIYERYTHLGNSNFIRYALRAATRMKARSIRQQISRHWERVREEFDKPLKS